MEPCYKIVELPNEVREGHSLPQSEYDETWHKAEGLIRSLV